MSWPTWVSGVSASPREEAPFAEPRVKPVSNERRRTASPRAGQDIMPKSETRTRKGIRGSGITSVDDE